MLDEIIHRREPTWFSRFVREPNRTLARTLYSSRQASLDISPSTDESISVACLSDTHNSRVSVPDADVLIHAGDLTQNGTPAETQAALDWLASLPHRYKIVIAGNHDRCLEPGPDGQTQQLNWGSLVYLDRSSTTLAFPGGRKVSVYGNPLTRRQGAWAFQYDRGRDVFTGSIPEDVDILVTHSPPRHHLDLDQGDENLAREVWRTRPSLHVCGHIHAGRGRDVLLHDTFQVFFEEVMKGTGGFLDVLAMCLMLLYQSCFGRTLRRGHTVLHNAAIVGGFRDEVLREPAVHYI